MLDDPAPDDAAPDRASPHGASPGRRAAGLVVAAGVAALFAVVAVTIAAYGRRPPEVDTSLHLWAVGHRTAWVTTAARVVTATGTGIIAYLLAAAAGARLRRSRPVEGALAGALILLVGQSTRGLVAAGIGRSRPPAGDWAASAHGWSFPSGHTTSATIVAVLLATAFTRTSVRCLVVVWAAAVGFTRVYLGMHWPTDVLGGWLFGTAFAVMTISVARRFL